MNFIFSPSNLKTFVQCPAKFKAMNIDKTVPYVQSEQAKRGEQLHALMETAINHGWEAVQWTDAKSQPHAHKFTGIIRGLMDNGYEVHTEVGVATDGYGHGLDYWAKAPQNFLRCRIDVLLLNKEKGNAIIFDHKTGKKYGADALQLQANAVCVRDTYGISKFITIFDYLDSGDMVKETIDVSGVDLRETDPLKFASSPCLELLNAVSDAQRALSMNKFIPTKNRFCSYCPLYEGGMCIHSDHTYK